MEEKEKVEEKSNKEEYLDLTEGDPKKIFLSKIQKPKKQVIPLSILSEDPVDVPGNIDEIGDVENIEVPVKSFYLQNQPKPKKEIVIDDILTKIPINLKEEKRKDVGNKKYWLGILIFMVAILIMMNALWFSLISGKDFNPVINNNIPETPINVDNPVTVSNPINNSYKNNFNHTININIDLSGEIIDKIVDEINKKINATNSS